MSKKLKRLQHSFEQAYQQDIVEINHLKRNVYYIETKTDKYILKCFPDYTAISWQDKLVTQMIQQGAKGIIPFIKNKKAQSVNYIEEDNLYYGIMPFIPGQAIDHTNFEQITDCIKLLGQFHAHGSGIYGKEQIIPFRSNLYERWNQRLEHVQRSFNQMDAEELAANGLIPFAREYGKLALEWGYIALERFPKAYMLYLEEQAQWERQVAHLDVALHNFIVLDKQQYYLLDYDLVDYAPPLIDLVQYINRVMPYYRYSIDLVKHLITKYETHYPLPEVQKKHIPILLIYPNDFFREWLGLWKRKEGYHPERVAQYFRTLEQTWKERIRFVQACLSMLQ